MGTSKTDNDFFTTFIFPFKYEMKGDVQLKPDDIAKKLNPVSNKNLGWNIEHYRLNSPENYNEYYYFHPFVREALFNKKNNSGMEYLNREDYKNLEVVFCERSRLENAVKKLDEKTQLAFINLRTKYEGFFYEKNPEELIAKIKEDLKTEDVVKERLINLVSDKWGIGTITTDVKSIDLHLFDNKIGILTITTGKRDIDKDMTCDDFLRYNDIARRVYPPYLGSKHNTDTLKYDTNLLPLSIKLLKENGEEIKECFDPIKLDSNGKDILCLSDIVRKLLAPFELKDKHDMKREEMVDDVVYYTPFTDDRMFIVSYCSDNARSKKLQDRCCDGYVYETSDEWYRFIFVDGNYPNIANKTMKKELIRKHTYGRWADSGTLYGMSRYSFVMLCDGSDFSRTVLKQHMKSMYYQIALIVLFQQAMLLKFSEDIQKATDLFKEGADFSKLQKDASRLHGDFIKFINKYWFIEVTPQEQGIEIYNQWISLLNVEKLFNEVQREIAELDSYVSAKIEAEMKVIEDNRNEHIRKITIEGFPLAIVAIILSFWQIYAEGIGQIMERLGILTIRFQSDNDMYIYNSFIILIPVLMIVYFAARKTVKKFMGTTSSKDANSHSR